MSEVKTNNIRDILQKVQYFWVDVWSKKWWIIIISLLVCAGFVINAWLTPKTYPATISFMVNEESEMNLGGMGSLLGSFGMGSKAGSNYEKIGVLSKSRRMIETTMLQEVDFQNKSDLLVNFLIPFLEQDEFKNIKIEKGANTLEHTSDTFRTALYKFVVGTQDQKGILSYDFDDESTVMTLTFSTEIPDLSIVFAHTHYNVLSDFYVESTIEKKKKTYETLSHTTDSIYGELRSAEYRLANFSDQSVGLLSNVSKLPRAQLAKKIEVLYLAYGEALKNRETAHFMLKSAEPYFQLLDTPLKPLRIQGKSRAKALIIGGFVGLLIGLGIVVGRRFLLDELNRETSRVVDQ